MCSTEICFYQPNKPYFEFSNFYGKKIDKSYQLVIDEKSWLSTEHYFQAMKFKGPKATPDSLQYAELVATADTPYKAKILATQKKNGGYASKWKHSKDNQETLNALIEKFKEKGVVLRSDWEKVKDNIMLQANVCKYAQNKRLALILKNTKGKKIIEHSPKDRYWGDGGDGTGRNKLGRILMHIRDHGDQLKC